MRRKQCETSEARAWEILDQSPFVTIACHKGDGSPYAVNVSIARVDKDLYFHCAKEGCKNEGFYKYPSICVSGVSKCEVSSDKFTLFYASVILDGEIHEVNNQEEKRSALQAICERYTPNLMEGFHEACEKSLQRTTIFKIKVKEIHGKEKN